MRLSVLCSADIVGASGFRDNGRFDCSQVLDVRRVEIHVWRVSLN